MRILFVAPSFHPASVYGGPIVSTLQLGRHLARAGNEVRVLTTDANGKGMRLDVDSGRETAVEGLSGVRYCRRAWGDSFAPGLALHLPGYVRWADVVHLTAVYSWPTMPALLACRFLGRPLMWSPRGALQRWEGTTRRGPKAAWDAACRLMVPRRAALHVTSPEEEIESRRVYPGLKYFVIPNGVEPGEPRERARRATNGLRMLFLGRIDPKKGVENLVAAGGMLRGGLKWELTIAGDGEREYVASIRRAVAVAGVAGKVSMIGHVSGLEREEAFARADLVVVPSHTENFCNVVAEALVRGVPVLAGTGTPWRRLEEKGCGRWVPNDPETLARTIEEMARMPLREMGERGRAWMAGEFSWTSVAAKMVQAYGEMTAA